MIGKLLEELSNGTFTIVEEGMGIGSTQSFENHLEHLKKNEKAILEMKTKANAATFKRAHPKVGKNDPCPCGSGLKYKKCHMREQERQYVIIA